jgi:hypothetical protein
MKADIAIMRRVAAIMESPQPWALVPDDDASAELIRKIPLGEPIAVRVIRSRSLPQHRLFFSILSHVAEATEWGTAERLLVALKIRLGRYDLCKLPSGKAVPVPQSISFDALSQDAFQEFMDKALIVICDEILPHMSTDDLIREVCAQTGLPRPGATIEPHPEADRRAEDTAAKPTPPVAPILSHAEDDGGTRSNYTARTATTGNEIATDGDSDGTLERARSSAIEDISRPAAETGWPGALISTIGGPQDVQPDASGSEERQPSGPPAEQNPERVAPIDLEPKPDDAGGANRQPARTSAGSSGEGQARQSAPADARTLPPASNVSAAAAQGTAGDAGGAGGSPATDPSDDLTVKLVLIPRNGRKIPDWHSTASKMVRIIGALGSRGDRETWRAQHEKLLQQMTVASPRDAKRVADALGDDLVEPR